MNKIEQLLNIRLAYVSDADRIMEFIGKNVKENHIYAINKSFFLYEFQNGQYLNFIIAEEKDTNDIVGIYGFYIYSHSEEGYDYAGGISQVSVTCKIPLVGTCLYRKIEDYYPIRVCISVGMNEKTSYELNRRRANTSVGQMSHFYMLSGKENYYIAKISKEVKCNIWNVEQKKLTQYLSSDDMYRNFHSERYNNRLPYKDRHYIEHRYFNHPIYKYRLYGCGGELVVVCREVNCNGARILRIVDLLGDVTYIRYIGLALQKMMAEEDYEYIDFLEYGMDEADICAAGFSILTDESDNIIPNYFEPFERRNINLLCATMYRPALIFKADADQDRPSIVI